MKGTESKQANELYQGIVNYYASSGLEITADEVAQRDSIIANNGIICDDALDEQVLAIQDEFIAAEDASAQKAAIEKAISLLAE